MRKPITYHVSSGRGDFMLVATKYSWWSYFREHVLGNLVLSLCCKNLLPTPLDWRVHILGSRLMAVQGERASCVITPEEALRVLVLQSGEDGLHFWVDQITLEIEMLEEDIASFDPEEGSDKELETLGQQITYFDRVLTSCPEILKGTSFSAQARAIQSAMTQKEGTPS